jgi:transposase
MWGRIGEQSEAPAAGQDMRLPVFGALDATTGRWLTQIARRKNRAAFLAHLREILKAHPDKTVFLFVDNCSIHKAKCVQRFLADHRRLRVIWKAAYTPELNLIERYWKRLKEKAINNYYFGSHAALEQAVRQAIRDLNRSKELRMAVHLKFLDSLRGAA